MTEKAEEIKGTDKENHELCIKAGATAGEIMRCVVETVKKTGKAGEAVAKFGDKVSDAASRGCHTICGRVGEFKRNLAGNKEFAEWESKQKDIYAKIGEIIFKEKELNKVETPENIFERKDVEELLKKANAFEKEIQKIKDEMVLRKQEAETLVIIKRAEKDLQNEDPRIRRVAVRVLERVGTKGDILPIISKALEDSDLEVRERAAEIMHSFANSYKGKGTAKAEAGSKKEEPVKAAVVVEKKTVRKVAVKKETAETAVDPAVAARERSAEMMKQLAAKFKQEVIPESKKSTAVEEDVPVKKTKKEE